MRLQSCNAGCNCFSPRSAVDHAERSVRQKGSLKLGILGKHGEWTANEFQCTHAEFKYLRLTATQTHNIYIYIYIQYFNIHPSSEIALKPVLQRS